MTSFATSAQQPSIVYQQDSLFLLVSTKPDPNIIALLQQTVYGTEGIRYRQTGQAERISQLVNPFFFQLYDQQTLIGLYCLDQRPVGFRGQYIPGYYGRYLAVRADKQGKGYGRLLKSTAVDFVAQHHQDPYLLYSYIEAKNTRSMAASVHEQFTSVAKLSTFLFRRFSPRIDARFRTLSPDESALAQRLVAAQYAQYGFQHFTHINQYQSYYVLEEAGQIVAGVQASPIQWQFVHIPGRLGPLIRHVAPHIPGLRRFFNPSRQSFLTVEGVYIAPGREELLAPLLESALAQFGQHTVMWQIDERDPLRSLLSDHRMGWLSQFQPGVTTHVLVKAVDLPVSIDLRNDPVYVSSFDFS